VAALEGCGHRGGGRRLHQAREDLLADQRPFIFLRNVPKRVAREARPWLRCFSREAGSFRAISMVSSSASSKLSLRELSGRSHGRDHIPALDRLQEDPV
jgi:hypothetical protein